MHGMTGEKRLERRGGAARLHSMIKRDGTVVLVLRAHLIQRTLGENQGVLL